MLFEHERKTDREGIYDITAEVKKDLETSGVKEGILVVYCPHTTAGITINENADDDVKRDLLFGFRKAFLDHPEFKHDEGNSSAHVKCTAAGSSVNVIITDAKLLLGVWQSVFFAEFDGPRSRKYYVKILKG